MDRSIKYLFSKQIYADSEKRGYEEVVCWGNMEENEGMKEGMNKWMKEGMNGWMDDWRNERKNE